MLMVGLILREWGRSFLVETSRGLKRNRQLKQEVHTLLEIRLGVDGWADQDSKG